MRALVLTFLALLAACGAAPAAPTAPAPAAAASEPPRAPRLAKLRYELRGRPFPLPIVLGTVDGHPVTMLVDTGANSHVIAGWFARKVGLPLKKLGDVGTDHVGKSIATFRVEKPNLAIEGWGELTSGAVLATEVPEVIEKLGIGVFISPQRLVEEGDAVVLDLQRAELRPAQWDEAHFDLSATGAPLVTPDEGHACEENDGPIKGLAFVVPATIEAQRVDLLVDTGAQHSDVFTSSRAGQRLVAQSTVNKEAMYTASGKISGRQLRNAKVIAGAYSVSGDIDLIGGSGDSSCPRDGVLAMDVLRSCALLLGRRQMFARCVAPDATTPAPK